MNFSDCLRSRALDVYEPLKSSDPNEDLEVFFQNQSKIFSCAVESDLGNHSSAYEYAFDRERGRVLSSLGAKQCQVLDLEERLRDVRGALWLSRPAWVEEVNQRRQDAALEHARQDRGASPIVGALGGGLLGIGMAYLAKPGFVFSALITVFAALIGFNAGDTVGFQMSASDYLDKQGGTIDPLREGTRDEEAPQALFDELALQDAEMRGAGSPGAKIP